MLLGEQTYCKQKKHRDGREDDAYGQDPIRTRHHAKAAYYSLIILKLSRHGPKIITPILERMPGSATATAADSAAIASASAAAVRVRVPFAACDRCFSSCIRVRIA